MNDHQRPPGGGGMQPAPKGAPYSQKFIFYFLFGR